MYACRNKVKDSCQIEINNLQLLQSKNNAFLHSIEYILCCIYCCYILISKTNMILKYNIK